MDSNIQHKRNRKKKKGFKGLWRIILSVVLIFVIYTIVYGYGILSSFSQDTIEGKKAGLNDPVNVLVLGVDAGDYESTTQNAPKRSDTMLLINFDPKGSKVQMLTIPRDTRININGKTMKINAAHAIGGPELAIETVEDMLSIDINYYVKLDYEGFRQCIDAIGGIDMVIPRDMDYDAVDISIHFKKGEKVHLDGEKAEQFVRWRKNNSGGGYAMGDLGRQETQQEFLIKILEKLKTPQGMVRLPKLLKTVSKYVKTNLPPVNMLSYALKLKSIETSDISKEILPGEAKYISGVSYYIWDRDLQNDVIKDFRGTVEVNSNLNSASRRNIKITVLNATNVTGHAGKYAERLRSMGYDVLKVGNYSQRLSKTLIEDYTSEGHGEVVGADLEVDNIVKILNEDAEKGIVVILGTDSVK